MMNSIPYVMNSIPRRLIIIILHLVVQYGLFRFPIWPILHANISHFTAQYHPYCTPIWPILQRGFYVIGNQLLRNPFQIVLSQSRSPLLWRGRGRLSNLSFPSIEKVGGGSLYSLSLPLGGPGWVLRRAGMGAIVFQSTPLAPFHTPF